MKRLTLFVAVAFIVALAVPAFADNGAPSGSHYNLNIIGVSKDKKTTMTDSDRHTIFVALGASNAQVTSKIYLKRGPDFHVCDGNAFDPPYDCDGNVVYSGDGAVFELPCNLNLPAGSTECGDSSSDPCLVPCTAGDSATYTVWARALGSPKNNPYAVMTTCAIDEDTNPDTTVCSTENTLQVGALTRGKGQEKFVNVTKELSSLVMYNTVTERWERVALFAGGFEDWFWQYENHGLKLAQLRFYLQ